MKIHGSDPTQMGKGAWPVPDAGSVAAPVAALRGYRRPGPPSASPAAVARSVIGGTDRQAEPEDRAAVGSISVADVAAL